MNLKFDKSWTVFLDRDGVINTERRADYVKTIDEFIFEEGALEALKKLNDIFGVIVIITNQRGVGSGIMSVEDLNSVHNHMLESITSNGGRIDKIYYSPYLAAENHPTRKPGIGMALQAKKDFFRLREKWLQYPFNNIVNKDIEKRGLEEVKKLNVFLD